MKPSSCSLQAAEKLYPPLLDLNEKKTLKMLRCAGKGRGEVGSAAGHRNENLCSAPTLKPGMLCTKSLILELFRCPVQLVLLCEALLNRQGRRPVPRGC